MKHHKILLCFSGTGAGHLSAAVAIKEAIHELSPSPDAYEVLIENVIEKSLPIDQALVHLYNYLLRYHQDWMKYYRWGIDLFKPNQNIVGYWFCRTYALHLFRTVKPSVVVSVHPMTNQYISHALKDLGVQHKLQFFIVVTDPNANLWKAWACKGADLTICPNDLVREKLIKWGVSPTKIETIGMPINPAFLRPPKQNKAAVLAALGLDPTVLTVLLSSGSAGGGNTEIIFNALQKVAIQLQVVVLCGKNPQLIARFSKLTLTSPVKTVVLPYVESTVDLFNACDLLITKAGGLTTFEAIAVGLPMAIDMITKPMPQEFGTAEMLIECGLAQAIEAPSDIIAIVEAIRTRKNVALPKQHNLNRVDAVYEIAREIMKASVIDSNAQNVRS